MEPSTIMDEATTDSAPKLSVSEQLLTHWQGVYLLALRITDDAHAAEDIVQDAYVKALERIGADRPDNPRTWLFSIAANLARNWIRDRSTHRRLEKTMAYEKAAEVSAPQSGETVLALRNHFKGLDEKYRTALSLHYEQGLTYREVAAVLQKPEGTAASLITRGVELLRQSLAGEGHTVAPAIVALELQKWGAAAAPRPELLAALKAALASQSLAGGASAAVAAKTGATVLTGKAVVAGGLMLTAALVLAAVHFSTLPPTKPAPVAAPVAPVVPVKAPTPPASAQRTSFDSELHFVVEKMKDDGSFEDIGETPALTEAGIAVPADDSWLLRPHSDQLSIKQVLAEVRMAQAPGLNLSQHYKSLAPDQLTALVELPHLKTLVIHQDAINANDLPMLKQMKTLERLYLYQPKLDEASLAALSTLPNLRVLLARCPISDAGAMELLKLQKLQSLAVQVSPDGLGKLSALPALTDLDLRGSDVLDEHILANPALVPKNLKALSLGKATEKLQKLAALRALLPHVRVNGWNALADEPAGQKSPAEDEKDALVALDRFSHDAMQRPQGADPEVASVMHNRLITADFVDMPVAQALATIADQSEIRIVMDPALPNSDGLANINLRVADMSCGLALDWILKLCDLQHVTVGHTVIVGNAQKIRPLVDPVPREFTLGANPGEEPWTQAETEALAGVVNLWSVIEGPKSNAHGFPVSLATSGDDNPCKALRPGKIKLSTLARDRFEQFTDDFLNIPPGVVIPRWIDTLMKRAGEPLTLPLPAQRPTIDRAVSMLNKAVPGLNLVLDPKLATGGLNRLPAPVGWPGKTASTADAIAALCNEARCTLTLADSSMLISKSGAPVALVYPVILDLRPALKAGAPEGALTNALAELVKEGGGMPPVAIRGRWLAATDPVTARMAMAVLDEAAKSGKVPSSPPAPWYFELAKNAELQLPKPPKIEDAYDGSGY